MALSWSIAQAKKGFHAVRGGFGVIRLSVGDRVNARF